jgi:hypothetical protein
MTGLRLKLAFVVGALIAIAALSTMSADVRGRVLGRSRSLLGVRGNDLGSNSPS